MEFDGSVLHLNKIMCVCLNLMSAKKINENFKGESTLLVRQAFS